MVAQATSQTRSASGLRAINSSRDLVYVSQLIERAFAADMDESGRNAMREMRWMSRLFGWLDVFGSSGASTLPGYVWLEDGRIVGNVTVRRLSPYGPGWMIGNVAVDPEWRGRGIARQLMQTAVDHARERNAAWLALQVRTDNEVARTLYRTLGFEDVGETVHFEATELDPVTAPAQPVEGRLRAARSYDTDQLFTLAQSLVPATARWTEPLYRNQFDQGFERQLSNWLSRKYSAWQLIETADQLWGAAMVDVQPRTRQARLGLWVVPSRAGRIEQVLVDGVLAQIHTPLKSISARLPGQHIAGRVALLTRGFRPVRALTHMRLKFQE